VSPLDEEVGRRKGLRARRYRRGVVARGNDQVPGWKAREQPPDHLELAEIRQIFAHERRIAVCSARANACLSGHPTAIIALWQPAEGL